MSRKSAGTGEGAANDERVMDEFGNTPTFGDDSADVLAMTTSPAFDIWLDRQMKTLLAACDTKPDHFLVDLIRREFAKRQRKVTE